VSCGNNQKKKDILTLMILILIVVVSIILYMWPRPIVRDTTGCEIRLLQKNPHYGEPIGDFELEEEYNEQAILECLSRYKAFPSLSRANGYLASKVKLTIFLSNGDSILVGDINYYDKANGARYLIVEANELTEELFEILGMKET
jgi:hypothetical protein